MKSHQTVVSGVTLVTETPARRRSSGRRRASRVVVRQMEAPIIEPPAITLERLEELVARERVAARLLREPSDEATVVVKVLEGSLPDRDDQFRLLAFMVAEGRELTEVVRAAQFLRLPLRRLLYHLIDNRLVAKPELVAALRESGMGMGQIEVIFDK